MTNAPAAAKVFDPVIVIYCEAAFAVIDVSPGITNNWGARCPDYEAGCCVCDMWKLRDDMVEIINPEE